MSLDLHDAYFHVHIAPDQSVSATILPVRRVAVRTKKLSTQLIIFNSHACVLQAHLFERQLCQPCVIQYLFAVCVGRVSDPQIQLACIKATALTHTLLRLENTGAGVASAGAQLQLLHAAGTTESSCPA